MQVRKEFGLLFDRYIPTSSENGRGFNPHSKGTRTNHSLDDIQAVFHVDERRRHVIFCLKPLTPEMERIHMSTIFHFLKTKCPKMVRCSTGSAMSVIFLSRTFAASAAPAPKRSTIKPASPKHRCPRRRKHRSLSTRPICTFVRCGRPCEEFLATLVFQNGKDRRFEQQHRSIRSLGRRFALLERRSIPQR